MLLCVSIVVLSVVETLDIDVSSDVETDVRAGTIVVDNDGVCVLTEIVWIGGHIGVQDGVTSDVETDVPVDIVVGTSVELVVDPAVSVTFNIKMVDWM